LLSVMHVLHPPFYRNFYQEEFLKFSKGGRSANNYRKSQIRKFVDFNNLLDLRNFRKCDTLRI
jgi:hypothetical protein